jgi:hypothetical protein
MSRWSFATSGQYHVRVFSESEQLMAVAALPEHFPHACPGHPVDHQQTEGGHYDQDDPQGSRIILRAGGNEGAEPA